MVIQLLRSQNLNPGPGLGEGTAGRETMHISDGAVRALGLLSASEQCGAWPGKALCSV